MARIYASVPGEIGHIAPMSIIRLRRDKDCVRDGRIIKLMWARRKSIAPSTGFEVNIPGRQECLMAVIPPGGSADLIYTTAASRFS